jgi:uncharacterized protein involved in propanediol utilization
MVSATFGTATVHGTFGELLQGYRELAGGVYQHFLFTLPVAELYSTSTVSLTPGRPLHRIHPPDRTRALTAATKLATALEIRGTQITVQIDSNIPVGKGCASSTADIMSCTAALLNAVHPNVPHPVVHALGSLVGKEIEWGDYVHSESIAICLQRTHTLVQKYVTDMRWRIVGIDEGGVVDTAAFHRKQRESRKLARYYESLVAQLDAALRASDHTTAAQISTESALLSQKALPKRYFTLMQLVAKSTGALGIAVAHSGTVVGLIFSEHQGDVDLRIRDAEERLQREGLATRVFTVREGRPAPAATAQPVGRLPVD